MKPRWLVSILVLLMASCGSADKTSLPPAATDPTAALETPAGVEATEAVLPSPTLVLPTNTSVLPSPTIEDTAIPTTSSLITPVPAATLVKNSIPNAIIAKLDGGVKTFLLVGGSQNGNWVSAGEVAAGLPVIEEYQLYTRSVFQGWITSKGVVYEPICGQHFVDFTPFNMDENGVGSSGAWTLIPRTPSEISTDNETYLTAVAAWQVEQAPSMPIAAIKRIWKVDVEGNGTDEVFINATRYAEPTGHHVEPRDYSVVLMRTVIGSEVVTIELAGEYYSETIENQFPLTYTLEFIGDLNGDGQMEVVVGVSRWEGMGFMVFEIDEDEVQLVLSVMCSL